MKPAGKQAYDVVVVGSGFGGTLTALGLHKMGFKVLLVEKDAHPRFAIGESSTPVADMILRDLGEKYDLPFLKSLSRYGSWQQEFPDVTCGLKKGFSYYRHSPHLDFHTDREHANEMLVAASSGDLQSDTHWFRAETDAFLVDQFRTSGADYFDKTHIVNMIREGSIWEIKAERDHTNIRFTTRWIVDATGRGHFLKKHLGIESESSGFRTNSSALFSHFQGVRKWSDYLSEREVPSGAYPFNPDNSALHHLIDEGWIWVLRFNNGITSAGIVFDHSKHELQKNSTNRELWSHVIEKYPSLKESFNESRLADQPGNLLRTGRLQRRLNKITGDGWVALPHTSGFIDPMHSMGIAHTLSGVERILNNFNKNANDPLRLQERFVDYETAVFNELDFIDLLVSGCHQTTHHFELFTLYSMLYFTATIAYEQSRLKGDFDINRNQFLSADHHDISFFSKKLYGELSLLLRKDTISEREVKSFRESIRRHIEPYNIAGLLSPEVSNMYHHTVAEL